MSIGDILPGVTTDPLEVFKKGLDPRKKGLFDLNPMTITHEESIEALGREPAGVAQAQQLPGKLEAARKKAAEEQRRKLAKRKSLIQTGGQGVTGAAPTRKPSLLAG
mgnify:CR=1 FL=1